MPELEVPRRAVLTTAAALAALATLLIARQPVVGHTSAAYQDKTHARSAAIGVSSTPAFRVGMTENSRMVDTGLGLGQDGNVYMWGRTDLNIGGSVANPGINRPPSRIPAMPAGGICQVTGEIYDADALACDGTVWGWGGFDSRNGTDAPRPNQDPEQVRIGTAWNGAGPLLDGIVAISSTEYAGAGIRADGTVWIWGGDTGYGGNGVAAPGASQLTGLPDPTVNGNRPVRIKGAYTNFFVILANGDVYSWGGVSSQPAGAVLSTTAKKVTALSPWFRSNVTGTAPYVVAVDGGINMGGALLSDGDVLSWSNSGDAFRIGGRPTTTTPANQPGVVPTLAGIASLQFGFTGVVFGKDNGDLWGYGASDDYGQLPMTPVLVDTNVTQYGAGQGYYIWQRQSGAFWGRGYNPAGAVGTPDGTVTANRLVSYDMTAVQK